MQRIHSSHDIGQTGVARGIPANVSVFQNWQIIQALADLSGSNTTLGILLHEVYN